MTSCRAWRCPYKALWSPPGPLRPCGPFVWEMQPHRPLFVFLKKHVSRKLGPLSTYCFFDNWLSLCQPTAPSSTCCILVNIDVLLQDLLGLWSVGPLYHLTELTTFCKSVPCHGANNTSQCTTVLSKLFTIKNFSITKLHRSCTMGWRLQFLTRVNPQRGGCVYNRC